MTKPCYEYMRILGNLVVVVDVMGFKGVFLVFRCRCEVIIQPRFRFDYNPMPKLSTLSTYSSSDYTPSDNVSRTSKICICLHEDSNASFPFHAHRSYDNTCCPSSEPSKNQ